jgi:transcriptional regulator with XRE-family HTH domain
VTADFQTAFGEVVREQRLAKGLTLRAISDNGYLALGYLSEVERGQKCPSSAIIQSIADGLGLASYELVVQAGLRMAQVPDNVESIFKQDPIRNLDWQKQYADLR